MKYPVVDCSPYYTNYPGTELEPFAIQEFVSNMVKEEAGSPTSYVGYLSCFCDQQMADGLLPTQTYSTSIGD
jgi:hypothetical protein